MRLHDGKGRARRASVSLSSFMEEEWGGLALIGAERSIGGLIAYAMIPPKSTRNLHVSCRVITLSRLPLQGQNTQYLHQT
jgi:hypothetical protein